MQLVINIMDANATELADALGFQAVPPGAEPGYQPPTLDVFLLSAIVQWLRERLAACRSQLAAETIREQTSTQEL